MTLLLGPLLRRVVGDRATVWVETSAPATVSVRAGSGSGAARTFTAFGRHYALVVVDGLPAASATPYQDCRAPSRRKPGSSITDEVPAAAGWGAVRI